MLRATCRGLKQVCMFVMIPRLLRGHLKSAHGKFQRLPSVTSSLYKSSESSDSDKEREDKEKCQRIIDYVFGKGPYPASDITDIPEMYNEYVAQMISNRKQKSGDKTKDRKDESDDEGTRIETVITSEEQPDIISVKKVKTEQDGETSLLGNEEVKSSTVDDDETKLDDKDLGKPVVYAEDPSPEQERPVIMKTSSKDTEITQKTPNKGIHKDDEDFLYENSYRNQFHKDYKKQTEVISNKESKPIGANKEDIEESTVVKASTALAVNETNSLPETQITERSNEDTDVKENDERIQNIKVDSDEDVDTTTSTKLQETFDTETEKDTSHVINTVSNTEATISDAKFQATDDNQTDSELNESRPPNIKHITEEEQDQLSHNLGSEKTVEDPDMIEINEEMSQHKKIVTDKSVDSIPNTEESEQAKVIPEKHVVKASHDNFDVEKEINDIIYGEDRFPNASFREHEGNSEILEDLQDNNMLHAKTEKNKEIEYDVQSSPEDCVAKYSQKAEEVDNKNITTHAKSIIQHRDNTVKDISSNLLHVTTSRQQTEEKLAQKQEDLEEIPIVEAGKRDCPYEQPNVLSNNEPTKQTIECSNEPSIQEPIIVEPDTREQHIKENLAQNFNDTIQMELFLPIKEAEESFRLYKASKIQQSHDGNASANALSLISSIEPGSPENHGKKGPDKIIMEKYKSKEIKLKKRLTDVNNVKNKAVLHSVQKERAKKTASAVKDKSLRAFGESKEDEDALEGNVLNKDRKDENYGNPFKGANVDPDSFHFDYLGENSSEPSKGDDPYIRLIARNYDTSTSPTSKSDHDKPSKTTSTPAAKFATPILATQKAQPFDLSKPNPQQLSWGTAQALPYKKHNHYLDQNKYIQNRPAAPPPSKLEEEKRKERTVFSLSQTWDAHHQAQNPDVNVKSEHRKITPNEPRKKLGVSQHQWIQQQCSSSLSHEFCADEGLGQEWSPKMYPPGIGADHQRLMRYYWSQTGHPFLRTPNRKDRTLPPTLIQPGAAPISREPEAKETIPLEVKNQVEESDLENIERNIDIINETKKKLSQLITFKLNALRSQVEKDTLEKSEEEILESYEEKFQHNCSLALGSLLTHLKVRDDMPLSEMIEVIRLRNQFLHIKEFLESLDTKLTQEELKELLDAVDIKSYALLMSKCGDKKPPCPPPPPCPPKRCQPPCDVCPKKPEPPPCIPEPPPPCTPPPPKPPSPKKCDCKCKFARTDDIFGLLPRRISPELMDIANSTNPSSDLQSVSGTTGTSRVFARNYTSTDILSTDLESFDSIAPIALDTRKPLLIARDFDPWVPIPSYPYPKKPFKPKFAECDPKCLQKTWPTYVKPKQKPCKGFPKRVKCSRNRSKEHQWNLP